MYFAFKIVNGLYCRGGQEYKLPEEDAFVMIDHPERRYFYGHIHRRSGDFITINLSCGKQIQTTEDANDLESIVGLNRVR